jgi:hypothetical protein
MNQIKSIQLGVIAICIATVPLSLAQMPRTRTSGSNQITTTTAAPRYSGSSGNVTRPAQIGINAGSATNIGVTTNTGARTAINAGAQMGISNQTIGMPSAATGKGGSTGNSTGATQTGINAATGTNTKANTNAGTQTGTAAGTGTGVKTTQPQIIIESTPSPNLSTPTPSLTPIPVPTPIPSPSVGPSPSPSP